MPQTFFDRRVLCIALTLGCTFTGGCANGVLPIGAEETPPAKISLDEPYAVYRAVLPSYSGDDHSVPFIVEAETGDAAHIGTKLDWVKEFLTSQYHANHPSRSFADGLLEAYRGVYAARVPLDSTRLAMPNTILMSSTEIDRVFTQAGNVLGWEVFHKRFGAGYTQLSAVGFSRDGTWALLSTSLSCGGLCGFGELVLLHKTDGTWRVVTKKETWMS